MKPFKDELLLPVRTRTTGSDRPGSKWIASFFVAGVEVSAVGATRLEALRKLQSDFVAAQSRWIGNVQSDDRVTCGFKDGDGVFCPRLRDDYGLCAEHK